MHVNKAIAPRRIFSTEKDGVGIADDSDMGKLLVNLRIRNRESALQIIRRYQ
jgi:hypothetical protein